MEATRMRHENVRLRRALEDLHAEVEMAESVGICLPDRRPSLHARDVLGAPEGTITPNVWDPTRAEVTEEPPAEPEEPTPGAPEEPETPAEEPTPGAPDDVPPPHPPAPEPGEEE